MNYRETMKALKAAGTAQNRKVYARHGVKGPMFGVSYANLGKLRKKIKVDHDLAQKLWASGNQDARALATMVADPAQMKSSQIDAWMRDVDNYGLNGELIKLVCSTPFALKKMEKWMRSKQELPSAAGWSILAQVALQSAEDSGVSDRELEEYLEQIEANIHSSPNRTRYSMNSALIAIALRSPKLQKKAIAAAKRIGRVEVDHGETNCKTPDAVPYIQRAVAHRRRKKTA